MAYLAIFVLILGLATIAHGAWGITDARAKDGFLRDLHLTAAHIAGMVLGVTLVLLAIAELRF